MLANSLIAFAESADEYLKKPAIETVRKLALGYPELCAWSGGIRLLIDSVIDTTVLNFYLIYIYIIDTNKL
jgi:rapamycin-insensitive companion of mTOR